MEIMVCLGSWKFNSWEIIQYMKSDYSMKISANPIIELAYETGNAEMFTNQ